MYWDIKIHDDGEEQETVRRLTTAQKVVLMQVFEREGVPAMAKHFTDNGEFLVEDTEMVNGLGD